MKALIYTDEEKYEWVNRPIPQLEKNTDAIVRIHKTTICGTDLHILHGNVDTCKKGRILGHEGIGHIVSVGSEVSKFKVGGKVLISCITACGKCEPCKQEQAYGHCEDGGWQLGNTVDGCQAEFVRIPHADHSLYAFPHTNKNEDGFLMLSDILPTGLEVGVLAGKMKEGCTLAVVGVGPVGLATIMAATAYKPSKLIAIDVDANRLNIAKSMGATHIIDNSNGTAVRNNSTNYIEGLTQNF